MIFIYSSASSLDQTIIWHHLISQQGLLSNDASLARHINTTLYELTFLPDVPQILTKAVLQVESIQVIGPSVSTKPMTLQFTLPVHAGQRVVPLNQTQTSRGITLTLQRVTFTKCTTGLSIAISPSLDHFETSGPLSFTLNGQSFTWRMYQENLASGTSSGTSTVNGMPGVPNATNEIVLLDQVNALPVGSDTIQIQVSVVNVVHTWTFQVTVPAPASA